MWVTPYLRHYCTFKWIQWLYLPNQLVICKAEESVKKGQRLCFKALGRRPQAKGPHWSQGIHFCIASKIIPSLLKLWADLRNQHIQSYLVFSNIRFGIFRGILPPFWFICCFDHSKNFLTSTIQHTCFHYFSIFPLLAASLWKKIVLWHCECQRNTAVSLRWKPSSSIRNSALMVKHLLETANLDSPVSENINNKTSLRCGHVCLLTFLYKRPSPQTLSIFIIMSNRLLNWVNSYFNSYYNDWETALNIVHRKTTKIKIC